MRTTINIQNDLIKRVKATSIRLNITTHELIAMLINIVISKNIFNVRTFNGVQYQNADSKKNWKKFHIRFDPQVYEQGMDLRKCFKFSVSFIISFAIIHYLDEIVEEFQTSTNKKLKVDNYPLNYIFIAKMFDQIQGFIVLWGYPEEKHLKNLIP